MTAAGPTKSAFTRFIERVVDGASRYAAIVLVVTLAVIAAGSWYSRTYLDLRTDLLELLPRDSEGFKAYEHQLGRLGGGANLIVVVESPDPTANEKVIDAVAARLDQLVGERQACLDACAKEDAACLARCGPQLIGYVESGTKDLRKFYKANKWLYAEQQDLDDADRTLDRQIAIRSGLVVDLLADDPPAAGPDGGAAATAEGGARAAVEEKKPTLGLDPYHDKWEAAGNKNDDFPTGYFCTVDRKMHGIRIVSTTTGTGDSQSERLIRQVEKIMSEVKPETFHKDLKWGLAGDIPNAQEEKESVMSDAVVATVIATVMILAGIAFYFRSIWSLPVVALPAAVGVSVAYAFATVTFGYINTAGLFLGAIILGNGINYPIVLLGRYREFRARGQDPPEARRQAVLNAFRAELVGAAVAAIAYGSLTVTRFRGFSQFGTIGFVGMLLVWLTIIPLVPAMLTLIVWLETRLPVLKKVPFLSIEPKNIAEDGTTGPLMRLVARATERFPWVFIALAVGATCWLGWRSVDFLKDPWEYNFSRLGSKATKAHGAGYWSNKADDVFHGKMNIAGARVMADDVAQVPALKRQILDNDAADPEGKLVEKIVTVWDMLPGEEGSQKKKLETLDRIRDRLTPGVINSLPEDEQERIKKMRPPESLRLLVPGDLPPFLQRRFSEKDGRLGTVTYIKFKDFHLSDGRIALRVAKTSDNVRLPDGVVVQTASHSTIYSEMIKSMRRDGPLASFLSFALVAVVVIVSTHSKRGAFVVLASLLMGVICTLGGAAIFDARLHYVNFIALPITFGIGCEYPFNVYDRTRILGGDISLAVRRTAGAVALCSYTTIVGYSSLVFNDFQALQSFGQLAMAGEAACIVAAIFVVPSLLFVLRGETPS